MGKPKRKVSKSQNRRKANHNSKTKTRTRRKPKRKTRTRTKIKTRKRKTMRGGVEDEEELNQSKAIESADSDPFIEDGDLWPLQHLSVDGTLSTDELNTQISTKINTVLGYDGDWLIKSYSIDEYKLSVYWNGDIYDFNIRRLLQNRQHLFSLKNKEGKKTTGYRSLNLLVKIIRRNPVGKDSNENNIYLLNKKNFYDRDNSRVLDDISINTLDSLEPLNTTKLMRHINPSNSVFNWVPTEGDAALNEHIKTQLKWKIPDDKKKWILLKDDTGYFYLMRINKRFRGPFIFDEIKTTSHSVSLYVTPAMLLSSLSKLRASLNQPNNIPESDLIP
jgi:hypothetical protein